MTAKILIVEDDEMQRRGFRDWFVLRGYQTETASDGLEGMQKVKSFKPDIVITDLQMPGMDGLELVEKASAVDPGIGFFIVTAFGTIQDAVRSMRLGAVNFLEKPFLLSDLDAELKTYLEGRQRSLRAFLCHSSVDKPALRKLYRRLVRDRVDVWFDEERLMPGQDWNFEIRKAVRDSDVVIVCLSPGSISKEGYVQKEIKIALDVADEKPEETIFVIPAKLQECQVPDRLQRWQWVNLFEPKGYPRLLRTLRARAGSIALTLEPRQRQRPTKSA